MWFKKEVNKEEIATLDTKIPYDKEGTYGSIQDFISYQEERINSFDWSLIEKCIDNKMKTCSDEAKKFILEGLNRVKGTQAKLFLSDTISLHELINRGLFVKSKYSALDMIYLYFPFKEIWLESTLKIYGYIIKEPENNFNVSDHIEIDVDTSLKNIMSQIEETKKKYQDFDFDSYEFTPYGHTRDLYLRFMSALEAIKIKIVSKEKFGPVSFDYGSCLDFKQNFTVSWSGDKTICLSYSSSPQLDFDYIVSRVFKK